MSSAGVVFALMAEVPAVTLAAWRLQLTSVFLGVGAAFQLRRMPGEDRQRTVQQAGLLAASGACLALHFGTWVYSVQVEAGAASCSRRKAASGACRRRRGGGGEVLATGAALLQRFSVSADAPQATSLTHSLLFVSATPLFLAGGTWALGRPISRGELGGTAVGLVGAVLLATAAARSDAEVRGIGLTRSHGTRRAAALMPAQLASRGARLSQRGHIPLPCRR